MERGSEKYASDEEKICKNKRKHDEQRSKDDYFVECEKVKKHDTKEIYNEIVNGCVTASYIL